MADALELDFGVANFATIGAYDATKINGTALLRQFNLGSNPEDKFIGAIPNLIARPLEQSVAFAVAFPHAVQISTDIIQWYLIENGTAAATRRVMLYETNLSTAQVTWKGFITLTPPAATNHTVRGFRMTRDLYSVGTVAVSGTAVTGTGTAWQTARFAVGARIGFGSTDPTAITTWYQITAMGSDTGITLGVSAGTIAAGTAYVIEELRAVVTTTNATATNGGLFVAKGLNPDIFTTTGTTIPAATTVDNIRAVFWLKDTATITNTAPAGAALLPKVSNTDHSVYVLDTAARVFVYNLRAALTLTSGAATNAFVLSTGVQAVTGTMSQINNGRIGTLNHGSGSGVQSLYFVTTTRVYRCAISGITSGTTTWQTDLMTEVPPGGVNTHAATANMTGLEIADSIDRLLIVTNASNRHYVTQYNTVGGQFDHVWLSDTKAILQGTAALSSIPNHPNTLAQGLSIWSENGFCCICTNGTTAATNLIYWVALGAHWGYGQRLITPKLTAAGAWKYNRVALIQENFLGALGLGYPPNQVRVLARTSGIDDNTGAWVTLGETHDLSGLATTGFIQFAFEFQILTPVPIPARLFSLMLSYESRDLPTQLTWNADDTDPATGIFGFIQSTLFPSSVPVFTIEYRKVSDNTLVLTQISSGSANGVFEFHNGSTWVAGTGTNALDLRRRFRPTTTIPISERLYALIRT